MNNLRTLAFWLTLLSLIFIVSCKTVKVAGPPEKYVDQQIPIRTSVVSFTAQSKITDIQNELNRNFAGLIYEDPSLDNNGGDNIMVKAWKQGDIRIDMKGNVLSYRVPLKTWIKAGFKFEKFGITVSDYRELNAALALNFKTAVTLNADWSVSTKTTSDGYEWLSTPVVTVGGVDVSVKFVADLIMQSSLKDMGKMMDESIKDYMDLKPYAQQAWDLMNQPVKLNDEYNVWLRITPQKLISSRLNADNGKIVHKAGITGVIRLSMGNESSSVPQKLPLPDLLIGDIPNETTTVYAYITLPYGEISSTASGYLKGKTFEYGKRKVSVENIRIYGNEGNVIAETVLSGSLNGTLYFMGKPAYNVEDSTLVVNDFDYDISTKNFLIKSASWLYQQGFKRMISDNLKWSIKNEMTMVRSTVNNNLKSYKLSEGITLSGNVSKVEPGQVFITSDGLVTEIKATGKFGVQIDKLSFNN